MSWWLRYRKFIELNIFQAPKPQVKDLSYWRNKLFSYFVIYFLPISLIALIPGIIMSFIGGIPLLAYLEIFSICLFILIAFNKRIGLNFRKAGIIYILYILSVALLLFLGSFGPGLLYLFAITIFITLIFPTWVAYASILLNLLICAAFAVIVHFRIFVSPLSQDFSLAGYITIASNLVFLSMVSVALLDLVFTGLQKTILKEARLQSELKEKSRNLKDMLAAVETKNQELEHFAYIASHDLQEPLRTTTALVESLVTNYKGRLDEEADLHLTFLTQSAVRMRALISGLLDYSRVGKEKKLEWIDANQLLKEIIADLDATIKECKAELQVAHLPTIWGCEMDLKQLFQNLLSNALKFREKSTPPQVKINAEQEDTCCIFSVIDNGIGIAPKFQEKIFAIFQRLHPKSEYEGTGIGLAHCRKIVEIHQGKIWVEPNPEGGSIFKVKLPNRSEI